MYKQIIIARKDLNMSPGKLAAQVSHASMVFLTAMIKKGAEQMWNRSVNDTIYLVSLGFDKDFYEQWLNGTFTKIVLEAKNKNQLLKAVLEAEMMGMKEGEDFFLIKDNCYTELQPEEIDENGVGRTLTCIGFRPMDSAVIDNIGKRYQLLK